MKKNLFFILLSCFAFGQNKKIDSLKQIINSKKANFETYNQISKEYFHTNIDLANYYNDLSVKFIKNKKDKGAYLIRKANIKTVKGDLKEAEKLAKEGLPLSMNENDYTTIASGYNALASVNGLNGDFENLVKYSEKAYLSILKTKDNKKILTSMINYGSALCRNNETDKGIEIYKKAEKYFYKGCELDKGQIYYNLARLFLSKDDYSNTILNLEKAEQQFKAIKYDNLFGVYITFSQVYSEIKNESKTLYYLNEAEKYIKNEMDYSDIYFIKAKLYYKLNQLNIAVQSIENSIKIDEKNKNYSALGEDYVLYSDILNFQKKYSLADISLKKAIHIFKENEESENLQSVYERIIPNYFNQNNVSEYLDYFNSYLKLNKDFADKERTKSLYALNEKYKTLEKESKIKTQQLEIQKAQTNKNYALGGIAFLAMLLGGSFWFFKNRQKTTKLTTQNTLFSLQQNMRIMELQNLNQQLDSHDVKNLLGDMSSEIQEKAPDSYKKMIKFLNITKASLYQDSFTDTIEKQLQQAEDFLSLQQSSLAEPLHYHIENTLKDNQIEIPRLMLKNLVENAVKHGIKGKEGGGNITVSLTEDGHFLTIIVDDTGKGRTLKTLSNKGIGISTYQNLFATLNQKNKENAVFEMTDKTQGVKVTITIPKNYQYS